jgi:hypothetical protein
MRVRKSLFVLLLLLLGFYILCDWVVYTSEHLSKHETLNHPVVPVQNVLFKYAEAEEWMTAPERCSACPALPDKEKGEGR